MRVLSSGVGAGNGKREGNGMERWQVLLALNVIKCKQWRRRRITRAKETVANIARK